MMARVWYIDESKTPIISFSLWILKDTEKWTLKNHIFANLDEAAKLCKASNDSYNLGRWVAEGVAYDPYDFNA